MGRQIIAILIVCYAIAFAFGAMSAIRWPSLMMVAGFLMQQDPVSGIADVDWRGIGMAYGAPYFLSAFCFYAAALSVSKKQKGAMAWYLIASAAGFPCVFLVDFEPGWWQDPSAAEGAIAGAAAGAVLLGLAVWTLRKRRPKTAAPTKESQGQTLPLREQVKVARPAQRGPVPAAIARQRAHFAAEGRRMLARQQRR